MDLAGSSGRPVVDASKLLSLYHYSAGELATALGILRKLQELAPEEVEPFENAGVILRQLGRREEALEMLEKAHAMAPRRANICDALAHGYYNVGDTANGQKFGRLSLELKDREAEARSLPFSLPEGAPPPFSGGKEKRNIISFSLWGDDPRYLRGAIRNAQAAIDIYPGWTVRFYCDDSVPAEVIESLRALRAEVRMRPRPDTFFDGLLWRFEVVNDPEVERYLVRDCDSVVNVKERVAVDAWLRSEKWFHAMRDYPSHTEVILAGMWGGVSGALPPVSELRESFRPSTAPTRTFDQQLLREVVWPVARKSILIHDSVYTGALGSVPFPPGGELPAGFHVGQNEAAVRPDVPVSLPGKGKEGAGILFVSGLGREERDRCIRVLGGIPLVSTADSLTVKLFRKESERFAGKLARNGLGDLQSGSFSRECFEQFLAPVASGLAKQGEVWTSLEETDGDLPYLESFLKSGPHKLLCVIRDPRKAAGNRQFPGEEEIDGFARQWNAYLEAISGINRSCPGSVEMVRYEDLFGKRGVEAVGRICRFLGAKSATTVQFNAREEEPEVIVDQDVRQQIEKCSKSFLNKLRYPV